MTLGAGWTTVALVVTLAVLAVLDCLWCRAARTRFRDEYAGSVSLVVVYYAMLAAHGGLFTAAAVALTVSACVRVASRRLL